MEATQARVLVVGAGDGETGLMALWLQQRCQLVLAGSGRAAWRAVQEAAPALVLLDAALADIDALELCRQLKASAALAGVPVIVLGVGAGDGVGDGAGDGDGAQQRAFDAGATDVWSKPLCRGAVQARVDAQLELALARRRLADPHGHLDDLVAQRTVALERMQEALILAMGSLAETRDNLTVNHLRRTQRYVAALAHELREHPRFAAELSAENINLIYQAAPLHDVGKVGVPDAILLKPGRLAEEEYAVMKRHTVYGRDAILGVEEHLGGANALLRYAREIAYSHQEKFDGSGYPEGLAGEAIPMAARLMAVADVYDALISKRIYKPAFTHETAVEMIRHERGEHFDPDVVDAMLAVEEQIRAIAERFPDAP